MRPAATIEPWMEPLVMERWVHDAVTKEQYQRRLAIWWTACGRQAPEIATLLQTSARSVRRWIQSFNTRGPAALDGTELGGRRVALLSEADERRVLAALHTRARAGHLVTLTEVRPVVEARVGHPVSDAALYALLHRHHWRKVVPRPRHVKADPAAQEAFKRGSRRASNA